MMIGTIVATYGKTYTANTTFTLVIQPQNTAAPSLSTAPKDIEMVAGSIKSYSLSSITDVDGDSYTVSVTLGSASFVKFSNPTF